MHACMYFHLNIMKIWRQWFSSSEYINDDIHLPFHHHPGVGTFHRRDHLKHDRIGEEVDFQKYFWKYRKKNISASNVWLFNWSVSPHHLLPVCTIPTVIWLGDKKNSRPCFRADVLSEHLCKNNCLKFDQMILLSQLQRSWAPQTNKSAAANSTFSCHSSKVRGKDMEQNKNPSEFLEKSFMKLANPLPLEFSKLPIQF